MLDIPLLRHDDEQNYVRRLLALVRRFGEGVLSVAQDFFFFEVFR